MCEASSCVDRAARSADEPSAKLDSWTGGGDWLVRRGLDRDPLGRAEGRDESELLVGTRGHDDVGGRLRREREAARDLRLAGLVRARAGVVLPAHGEHGAPG